MNEYSELTVRCSVTQITFGTNVSVPRPVLRRALLQNLAYALEHGLKYEANREDFYETVLESISRFGTERILHPDAPSHLDFEGGYERLLRETNFAWQRLFSDGDINHHTFEVEMTLDASEIIHAFACVYATGMVDDQDMAEHLFDANSMLSSIALSYAHYGADFFENTVIHEVDNITAERVVRQTFPFLFLNCDPETFPADPESLEF